MSKKIQVRDPQYDDLSLKFINMIMKDGKKTIARRIFEDALKVIIEKGNKDPNEIFVKAIHDAGPSLEVKAKRIGGAVYQIPMEVKDGRRRALAMRWILAAARKKSGTSMAERLANELINVANGEGDVIKKKDETHRMAEANKAFAHYARY